MGDNVYRILKLMAIVFWVGTISAWIDLAIHQDGLKWMDLCRASLVGSLAAIFTAGAHVLQFTKLDDYNGYDSFIIGTLIASGYLIVVSTEVVPTLIVFLCGWGGMTIANLLKHRIDKYINIT